MKRYIVLLLMLSWYFSSVAQTTKYTVSGEVQDERNGEELIGATVYVEELKTGVSTNAYGYYAITLPAGKYTLVFSYIGYQTQRVLVDLSGSNKKLIIQLPEDKKQLSEVVISADRPNASNVEDNKMSTVKLDIKDVKKIPILLGEVDIIKAVQLLPGIQAAGDGNTLFIVRGGNVDHNLVQLLQEV
jgi:hypothetical protein